MGCGLTKAVTIDMRKRSETAPASVDDLKNRLLDEYKHVQKRFGHPSYYKNNGYDLGVRVDGHERYQSFYTGTSKFNNAKVTIKEHHLAHSEEKNVIQEVLILANLSHRALPELYEVFITDASVFTVSSLIESSRLSHIVDCKPNVPSSLSLHDTRCIIQAVIEATEHCHSKNVIIRNLTPANIVCKKTSDGYIVKIADFSMALMNGCSEYLCDSPFFGWHQVPCMAPEALLGNPYSYAMDMWGVGVLLFMMICNRMPFSSEDDTELMHQITHSIYSYPKHVSAAVATSGVKYLISQLLFVSTDMRLTAREALKNPWFSPLTEEQVIVQQ